MIINVPAFSCISCENAYAGVGYFLIEITLVMFMMVLLAVLHINITNGNLNAYILFSQMVTLQFPRLGFIAWTPDYDSFRYTSISFIVYSVWNLNFLTLISDPFCIPNIRTAVGVILLQYVIAACPLLFIIVSYTWIQCYNNGYRLVVYTTRPVHRLLARFWQKFKVRPSLIDTYAGLLLLAYMRFLAVSVKLLLFIAFDSVFASSQIFPVPLVIIPTLCLLVFVILPMAVLLLYPFKIFQRCLTCCKLDRPGLHALVDAYQGCFKNSATDGSERRYFAGIYLLFRFCYVAILIPLFSPVFTPSLIRDLFFFLPLSAACLSFVLAGLVLILRPYKKVSHNAIDFLILFVMVFLAVLSGVTIYSFLVPRYIIMGPLYLPFLCLVVYLIYRMFKCCCCCCTCCVTKNSHKSDNENNLSASPEQQPLLIPATTTEVVLSDYVQDDLYPDRIVNPGGYK